MFSKTLLKKMAQEVSPPVLLSMLQDAIGGLAADELETDSFADQIATIEMFLAELKKRIPGGKKKPDKEEPR